MPKPLLNNSKTTFKKSKKRLFAPKMVKMTLSEGQFLTKNFDFRGQISTFRAKNIHRSWPFKAKNNAQKTFDHLQNNFQKVQKTTFMAPEKF